MKFSAILFDLDGTLIHTTHLYEEAVIAAMASLGFRFTSADFRRLYPIQGSMEVWLRQNGADVTLLPQLKVARDEVYHELLRTRSEFFPGAVELLASLENIPTAAITNSWKSYLDAIHTKISLYDYLNEIVSADDMKPFFKPHPHGLVLAADRLGIDPATCAYVGDQPYDLHAAKAAGMHAVLIHGPHTPADTGKEADLVIESLGEIVGLV